jgi:large subunit ribosomal protein L25
MAEWSLAATRREPGHPGRARRGGLVPGVLYGRGIDAEALAIDRHALLGLLHRGGAHHVIRLKVGSARERPAMIKEIQWHPVDGSIVHVDFHAISLDEAIHAEVPLRVTGEAQVARKGGVVEQERHELRVSCLPADLPESIAVDVAALEPGDVVTVGDLLLPKGVRALDGAADIVLTVALPRAAEEPAAEAGAEAAGGSAAAAEPEVVGRRARTEGERPSA